MKCPVPGTFRRNAGVIAQVIGFALVSGHAGASNPSSSDPARPSQAAAKANGCVAAPKQSSHGAHHSVPRPQPRAWRRAPAPPARSGRGLHRAAPRGTTVVLTCAGRRGETAGHQLFATGSLKSSKAAVRIRGHTAVSFTARVVQTTNLTSIPAAKEPGHTALVKLVANRLAVSIEVHSPLVTLPAAGSDEHRHGQQAGYAGCPLHHHGRYPPRPERSWAHRKQPTTRTICDSDKAPRQLCPSGKTKPNDSESGHSLYHASPCYVSHRTLSRPCKTCPGRTKPQDAPFPPVSI